MSGLVTSSEKRLLLVSGRAYPELAVEVAECLGIEPTPTKLYDFANGEIFVRYLESVRGCDVFVLQSHTSPINEWIMEQLIMVDALKRASASRITVVAPFFGYARQDKKNRGREPISARLMSDLFETAGADRLMAVDLHTAQIQGFFDGPVDHLFALDILASYVEKKLDVSQVTVVAPDAGRVRVCERWTDRLGCPLAIIHKRRDPDVANQVRMFEVVGQVRGRGEEAELLRQDLVLGGQDGDTVRLSASERGARLASCHLCVLVLFVLGVGVFCTFWGSTRRLQRPLTAGRARRTRLGGHIGRESGPARGAHEVRLHAELGLFALVLQLLALGLLLGTGLLVLFALLFLGLALGLLARVAGLALLG
jgi:ribose-phosphate pyrophosphokinase